MEILIAENEDAQRLLLGGLGFEAEILLLSDVTPLILSHTAWKSVYVCAGDRTEAYVLLLAWN